MSSKHSNKGAPQIGYHDAMQNLQAHGLTGLNYNRTTASYWFDYNSTTGSQLGRHQIWIDTPGSTAIKYAALRRAGVRGVAWWHTGNVQVRLRLLHPIRMFPVSAGPF